MSLAGFSDLCDYRAVRGVYVRKLALSGLESAIDIILD
jgi:hypothetical protein